MTLDELRKLSSALFGHRYRLEMLVALVREEARGGLCVSQLASRCVVPSSVYYPSLKLLVSAGVVRRVGRADGDARVFYLPTGSPVWTGLRTMVEDLEVDIEFYGETDSSSRTA
ncbi:winged helix-turn-helix domain-containing protein [Actinomadura luteofluorescens]|uniref:winged helix-turn-helix domain-containing protein n=1 Tax=Actinomadura luteofluorescens TaxID=46163 RepID=UPI0021643F2B|nr:winged helix-turn-helix domain-containing protein [Actinomadura glauciflava]